MEQSRLPDELTLEYRPACQGVVNLPGSKSISNRALLLAAVAQGTTTLERVLVSDDTRWMIAALRQLGVAIAEPTPGQVEVTGGGGLFHSAEPQELYLGNAGTAMRPLVAMLAASQGEYVLTGEPRMCERPIGPLVTALRQLGADIRYLGESGYPPLRIKGRTLTGGEVSLDTSLSSQYVTALLMLLPQLTGPSQLRLTGNLVSLPYIRLTERLLARFGVQLPELVAQRYDLAGPQVIQSPGHLVVEGDASAASYFMAAGVLGGGPVEIRGAGRDSLQGDISFADVLSQLGASVTWLEQGLMVSAGQPLQGGSFDLNHIPDAAMTLAPLALFAKGPTEIRNVANWRLKETDRLQAMATELQKTGARVMELPDGLRIEPPAQIQHASIATYNDHRMAMCFALLRFAPAGVTIQDPACCAKTYPDFFSDFSALCHE